jgi:hypothetical protein
LSRRGRKHAQYFVDRKRTPVRSGKSPGAEEARAA